MKISTARTSSATVGAAIPGMMSGADFARTAYFTMTFPVILGCTEQ